MRHALLELRYLHKLDCDVAGGPNDAALLDLALGGEAIARGMQ